MAEELRVEIVRQLTLDFLSHCHLIQPTHAEFHSVIASIVGSYFAMQCHDDPQEMLRFGYSLTNTLMFGKREETMVGD